MTGEQPVRSPFLGVHHPALVTNDLDRTTRFYRDLLGMSLLAASRAGPHRHYFFDAGGGAALAFFEWPGVELPPPKESGRPAAGRNLDHVAISVASLEALTRLRRRLQAAGIDVSEFVEHGAMTSIYFEDPNGISLEFTVAAPDASWSDLEPDPQPVPAARP